MVLPLLAANIWNNIWIYIHYEYKQCRCSSFITVGELLFTPFASSSLWMIHLHWSSNENSVKVFFTIVEEWIPTFIKKTFHFEQRRSFDEERVQKRATTNPSSALPPYFVTYHLICFPYLTFKWNKIMKYVLTIMNYIDRVSPMHNISSDPTHTRENTFMNVPIFVKLPSWRRHILQLLFFKKKTTQRQMLRWQERYLKTLIVLFFERRSNKKNR